MSKGGVSGVGNWAGGLRGTYGKGEGGLEGLGVFMWVAHVAVDLEVVS